MDNLTPNLTQSQLLQNIDAMKGKLPDDQIQEYVNNYKGDGQGGYSLSTSQQGLSQDQLQQNLTQEQQDSAMADAQIKENTPTFGNVTKGIINAVTNSEQQFGTDIGNSAYMTFGGQNKINQINEQELNTADNLSKLAAKTTDPVRKQYLINQAAQSYQSSGATAEQVIGRIKSNEQILGDAGGVLIDALSAGTYGSAAKGAKTGKLLAPTAISTIANASSKAKGILPGMAEGFKTSAKLGAGVGGAYGVAQGMQQDQGVGGVFLSGLKGAGTGALTAGAIGATTGGLQGGLAADKGDLLGLKQIQLNKQQKAISGLADTLREVGDLTVKPRNILNKSEQRGRDVAQVLAESAYRTAANPEAESILPKVDKNGIISSVKQADAFNKQIDPLNNHVDMMLDEAQPGMPLADLEKVRSNALADIKNTPNLTETERTARQSNINKEMDLQVSKNGQFVPWRVVNGIKKAAWGAEGKRFDMANPSKVSSNYALGKTAMDMIEQAVPKDAPIHEANQEIGKLYEAEKFLRSLDGKRVLNGRLGHIFATGAGMFVGHTLPLPPFFREIAGGYAGDLVAEMLQKNTFSSKLKESLLRNLSIKDPQAFEQAKQFVDKSITDRASRLMLSSPDYIEGQPWKGGESGPIKTFGAGQNQSTANAWPQLPAAGQTSTPKSIIPVANPNTYVSGKGPVAEPQQSLLKSVMPKLSSVAPKTASVDSAISKPLQPLAQEARQYKSAEEFVKAQPTVYHGSGTPLKQFNNKQGTFFTDNMMNAEGYAGGENVYEGHLNLKNPLVIDAKGRFHSDLKTPYGKTTTEIVSNVDSKKYDGVIFKNIKDSWIDDAEVDTPSTIYFAFKPKDAFLNESQLTDIWNEANKKSVGKRSLIPKKK
jgi:hypothetical protein